MEHDGYSPELITLLIAVVNALGAVVVAWLRTLASQKSSTTSHDPEEKQEKE